MKGHDKNIQIERFTKIYKRDIIIPAAFLAAFLLVGFYENNLRLPDDGLGLLQHKNIWVFLVMNITLPIIISTSYRKLNRNINISLSMKLKDTFCAVSEHRIIKALRQFSVVVGFCFFVGNSLQNAKLMNQLPFAYWDSIDYLISYIVSRLYKLYLFTFFIPTVIIYVIILLKSVSKLVVITETEKYPITNYMQIKALCSFGINILLVLVIPIILSSVAVYFTHDRFDITTVTTITVSCLCTVASFCLYIALLKNYNASLSDYKKKHILQINNRLSTIHQCITSPLLRELNRNNLDAFLKEEEYLCKVKEDIETQSKFPHAIKALITSVAPLLPTFIKIISSLEISVST